MYRTIAMFVFLLLFALPGTRVQSQPKIAPSMNEVIREVLANNPGLRATRTDLGASEGMRSVSGAWDPPQISLAFMEAPVASANVFGEAMAREYRIQQMIPFPGKRSAARDAADAGVTMTSHRIRSSERDVIAEVKRQYIMAYTTTRRIEVNQRDQELIEQMVVSVRSRYSVDMARQADVLRLETELMKLRNQRATLEQERRSAEAMLNTLRSVSPDSAFGEIPSRELVPFSYNPDSLLNGALALRPELAAMASERMMSEAELREAKRERLPDLMVGVAYNDSKLMPDSWEVMVGISIPIAPWSSGMTGGMIEQRQASVERSDAAYQDMKNMVRLDVYNAWLKARAGWEQTERYRTEILPHAQKTLESLRAAYQTNKADFLSMIDSYRMLQMYSMEHLMVVEQYLLSVTELERAVGSDIQQPW